MQFEIYFKKCIDKTTKFHIKFYNNTLFKNCNEGKGGDPRGVKIVLAFGQTVTDTAFSVNVQKNKLPFLLIFLFKVSKSFTLNSIIGKSRVTAFWCRYFCYECYDVLKKYNNSGNVLRMKTMCGQWLKCHKHVGNT